ncbi:MAG: putative DNA-binding transcriptional regulator YafY [Candidatus Pelagisphaera sp.]|jgi:predicted DNA-binding transcriptional regulator YafY
MDSSDRIHSLKRPAIERMMLIHKALQRGGFPNCRKLADDLEVSSKTVSRDIDFMRDRMLLPIEYEASEHGYCYTREVESLPTIDISEGELLALSIARKALDHYKGTPFEQPLANALNKLSASLPDTITANLSELSETISFKQGQLSNLDESTLKLAIKAALEKRVLNFQYKKPNTPKSQTRTVNPYHVTNYLGKWYLIAWDYQRKAMRTFLLARASELELQTETFELPSDFSADDYLWSSFGIWSKSGDHAVAIRIKPSIVDYVSENIWHPTQKIESQEDGTLIIRFELGSLNEISQWILSWGQQAEALEPLELRTLLSKQAQAVADLYN